MPWSSTNKIKDRGTLIISLFKMYIEINVRGNQYSTNFWICIYLSNSPFKLFLLILSFKLLIKDLAPPPPLKYEGIPLKDDHNVQEPWVADILIDKRWYKINLYK